MSDDCKTTVGSDASRFRHRQDLEKEMVNRYFMEKGNEIKNQVKVVHSAGPSIIQNDVDEDYFNRDVRYLGPFNDQ